MSTESISDRREHVRSIGVTAFAALLGVGAGLASAYVTGDVVPFASAAAVSQEQIEAAATDSRALILVLTAILVQIPLLTKTGLYTDEEFGPKHYLFITFMTFSLWFVVWGILLTATYAGAA